MSRARGPLVVTALVKQVPKGDHSGRLDADGRLERAGAVAEMNPWCRRAVAQAVRLARETGGRSTAITMGPPAAVDVLREALAWGVDDAVQLSDPALAGSDCLVTARALAATIRLLDDPPDLILVGNSSVDGSTGAVGAMLAELLGLPFTGPVLSLEPTDGRLRTTVQYDTGAEAVTIDLPAVVAVAERSCDPAKAPADTWPPPDTVRQVTTLDLPEAPWGLSASPTKVAQVHPAPLTRNPVIFRGQPHVQADRAIAELITRGCFEGRVGRQAEPVPSPHPADREIVALVGAGPIEGTRALLGAAAALAAETGGSVTAVRTPLGDQDLARWGADSVVELDGDEPRAVARALTGWLRDRRAWAVLGAALPWDREVLGRLAVTCDAGLMSDLVSLSTKDGRLSGLKPSGGGTLAEIVSHGTPQIATLRTGLLPLRTPRADRALEHETLHVGPDTAIIRTERRTGDDGDALDRAEVVIGIGRGVPPDKYDQLEPVRALLNAEFAATRKVTDQGWLPHGRQIGITGRSVAPRVYLAVGLSGNLNHLAGAGRAGTVVAINTDPAAEIFAHCDVGLVADWQEVMPYLVDGLRSCVSG
ncbi:FAD-binding protein [Kribbella pratensis]|uniref:Electron transfer flavoprotein small subunit n=1 Tax=Kribbella pratensis TaxID=2512112 RepID=A0A4R8BX19_9ACTN|nr:FAD-binding protein [Kribbella pratensis]TDW66076.1 electron transfer flavoprotein alpha subunit apoprotein /electron transfer flavoprotein beta subunit [Kribbella pratensis]